MGVRCRPAQDNRRYFEGMLWTARTGALWRHLPDEYGKWNSVFRRYREAARRLMKVRGIGPITTAATIALSPDTSTFSKGRDFAAWLGLTPKQNSTMGKTRLGKTSKMGQRDLRRLLIIGAMAVVQHTAKQVSEKESWLGRMLARKPKMLVAVALANKIARVAWALMARGGVYESPATV
ncbi:transposase [Brucella intermedia]|uniref:transposase n=1 Tax=Brucella intermedia TaxID=94625 RepID=UPI0024818173|nr:transposase [Brucella intermedia]